MPEKRTTNPPRVCPSCGTKFQTRGPSVRKRCCSRECADRERKRRGDEGRARTCPSCGVSFTVPEPGFRKRFCSRGCVMRARHRARREALGLGPPAPRPGPRVVVEVADRFWGRVDRGDAAACWLWQGDRQRNGYGRFSVMSKHILAHRFAYELAYGPIPEGCQVNHSCDVRACVNPAHLFPGTQATNLDDMTRKGRRKTARGEARANAKLTEDRVRTIRARYARGDSGIATLAREYGVGYGTMQAMLTGRTWRCVE